MYLLILGASGGCGRWLVRIATERGHTITALVRTNAAFDTPPGVVMQRGDVTDVGVLDVVLPGHDAVLSAIGLRRAGRSPWAPLRSPPDLTERTMRQLLPAMKRHGVPRLLTVSAGGVGESLGQLTWPVRRLVGSGNIAVAYRDLAAMEALLAASDRELARCAAGDPDRWRPTEARPGGDALRAHVDDPTLGGGNLDA
jgi:putative NADH-flavin reductase